MPRVPVELMFDCGTRIGVGYIDLGQPTLRRHNRDPSGLAGKPTIRVAVLEIGEVLLEAFDKPNIRRVWRRTEAGEGRHLRALQVVQMTPMSRAANRAATVYPYVWRTDRLCRMLAPLARRVIAALVVALFSGAVLWADVRGRVVAVADGDTITVLDADKRQHRIRLNGIDAPETGQPFSQVAKTNLSDLVFGKDVIVIGSKVDRYGRLVGTVIVGTTNANLEQLRSGLAWYYREYAGDVAPENRPLYEAAEAEARTDRRGLWRDGTPQPPWAFRGGEPVPSVAPRGLLGSPSPVEAGRVIGNRNSNIYHVPGCRSYNDVAERNRVYFATEAEAEAAGFRKARNCG